MDCRSRHLKAVRTFMLILLLAWVFLFPLIGDSESLLSLLDDIASLAATAAERLFKAVQWRIAFSFEGLLTVSSFATHINYTRQATDCWWEMTKKLIYLFSVTFSEMVKQMWANLLSSSRSFINFVFLMRSILVILLKLKKSCSNLELTLISTFYSLLKDRLR